MREYLIALLRKHCGATDVIGIGSMKELAEREAELKGVRLFVFDIDLGDGTTIDWVVARAAAADGAAFVALSSIGAQFPFKKLQAAGVSLAHKGDREAEIADIIQRTLAGSAVISKRVMEVMATGARDPQSPLKLLGPKEQQILALLGQRLSNDDIAAIVGTSPNTVADHRKRIMRKLDLHTIEEIIDFAIRHGLVFDSTAAAAKSRLKP